MTQGRKRASTGRVKGGMQLRTAGARSHPAPLRDCEEEGSWRCDQFCASPVQGPSVSTGE